MSVEQSDIIDGVGLNEAGTEISLIISDNLSWSDPAHLPLLIQKIESYVAAATSGSLAAVYPDAYGKAVLINLIYEHLPDRDAKHVLDDIRAQLTAVGIGFTHEALLFDY